MNSFQLVIPTCGRSEHLAECLESVIKNIPIDSNIKVLIIDNNPRDSRLSGWVHKMCTEYRQLIEYHYESCPGLTSARHAAISISNANIMCFVDDDVIFTPQWFRSVLNAFNAPDVAIAGGPTIPRFEGSIPNWFWDFLSPTPYGGWSNSWLSLLDIGKDVDDIQPNWIWGLNFAIRREVLIDCGGFHIDLVPREFMRWQGDGETGLTMKLAAKGYKAVYRQNSLLFHQCGTERLSPSYFAKRAFYQGVCNSFTELRKSLTTNSEVAPAVSLSQSRLRRALGNAKRSVASKFQLNQSGIQIESRWAESAAEVRDLCHKAEREGYLFHQREAAQDPELRDWICRENYFDVDLRNIYAEYEKKHVDQKALIND
jgi:GT2 family glycosyltransferase